MKKILRIILTKLGLFNFVLFFFKYKTNRELIKILNKEIIDLKKEIDKNYNDILNNYFRYHPVEIEHDLVIDTDNPVAEYSLDHTMPSGTAQDNTLCRNFVFACEKYFKRKVSYLDLGCSGGGLVRNFLEYKNFSIGVEGSNYSKLKGRAEWSRIPKHLFTSDITKPFNIKSLKNNNNFKFDIIGAWEVMEHLPEESLQYFFKNVCNHLSKDGIFLASVATFPLPHHICLHDEEWWIKTFAENGLKQISYKENFINEDFPRGGPEDWPPNGGFYIACNKI